MTGLSMAQGWWEAKMDVFQVSLQSGALETHLVFSFKPTYRLPEDAVSHNVTSCVKICYFPLREVKVSSVVHR